MPVLQRLQQHSRASVLEVDAVGRAGPLHVPVHLWHEVVGETFHRPQTDDFYVGRLGFSKFGTQPVAFCQSAFGLAQKNPPGVGQVGPGHAALDEPRAEIRLQQPHLPAQGRGGNVELVRRAPDRALPRNLDERINLSRKFGHPTLAAPDGGALKISASSAVLSITYCNLPRLSSGLGFIHKPDSENGTGSDALA